jgi:AraC-like DNA-binding protein
MPSVPLPFVVALLLAILLIALVRREEASSRNRPFLALIAVCAVQSMLVGLRWGYGIEPLRYATPIVAAAVPAIVFLSFGSLTTGSAAAWRHTVPVALVGVLVVFWHEPIDAVLIAIYLGYAGALAWIAGTGPDALGHARFDSTISAYRALQFAAAGLAASAAIDGLVALDLEWTRGTHAAALVAVANLIGLVVLCFAAAVAERSQPTVEPAGMPENLPPADSEEDRAVMARIDDLMRTQRLCCDENLTLERLARKAGIPARRISTAINRLASRNVSQYVNERRVAEACRLLAGTDQPITMIMFEAGFQTKSNFNREFQRVVGTSPSAWRAAQNRSREST